MANFRFMATNPDQLNLGGPETAHMLFPFDYLEANPLPSSNNTYPVQLSIEQAVRWWWKLLSLSIRFQIDTGFGVVDVNVGATRYSTRVVGSLDDGQEMELIWPGITALDAYDNPGLGAFNYLFDYEDDDWNGEDGFLSIEGEVQLFKKSRIVTDSGDIDIEHMRWLEDADIVDSNPAISPSFRLVGNIIVTSPGTEYSFGFDTISGTLTPSGIGGTISLLEDEGGGSADIITSSEDITSIEVTITKNTEFSWLEA